MSDFRKLDLDFHSSQKTVHPTCASRIRQLAKRISVYWVRYATSLVGFHVAVYFVLMMIWGTVIYIIENNGNPNGNIYNIAPCVNDTAVTHGAPPCGLPIRGIFYIDALFLGLSAISASGLLTVDFSSVSLATQIFTLFGFLFFSMLTTPIVPPVLRLFFSWRNVFL
jgi:hypothetical protein